MAAALHAARLGRPVGSGHTYSRELADLICDLLEQGLSLKAACLSIEDGPHEAVVRSWASSDLDGFYARYFRARGIGIDVQAESLTDIADDQDIDPQSRKVMIETRRWIFSKLRPDKYGEHKTVDHNVKWDGNLRSLSEDQLAALALSLEQLIASKLAAASTGPVIDAQLAIGPSDEPEPGE